MDENQPDSADRPSDPDAGETRAPRAWGDAFPLLRHTGDPDAEDLAGCRLSDQDAGLACVPLVATHAVEGPWSTRPLGAILPLLPERAELGSLGVPDWHSGVLRSRGVASSAQLRELSPTDLLAIDGLDPGAVRVIIMALAVACLPIALGHAVWPLDLFQDEEDEAAQIKSQRIAELTAQAMRDISEIADWLALIGLPDRPVLGAPLPEGSPEPIVRSRKRLERLRARDVTFMGGGLSG